ncbi:glucan endo-1,3-beta-glucosidase, acidic-like [Asparagus officinalis]|uniref:glucan endo-1,3-beta-glucosidase, acidic-like n=1 Tax=Asparagus officinalis TaxID=4686 RepID=UPI00098E0046|nr:glucan endo-1,3-beta-glucosidase, acidic-like [Asparagus officinalis]
MLIFASSYLSSASFLEMGLLYVLYLFAWAALLNSQLNGTDAKNLGVCYGRLGDNLPPPEQTVRLCDIYKIGRMRIYAPDHKIFRALSGSNVQLTVGIPNHEVHGVAADLKAAESWFGSNIQPYVGRVRFRNIVVGHDGVINENSAEDVLQAMTNLHTTVTNHGLQHKIKITTEVNPSVLNNDYSISATQGSFKSTPKSGIYMQPIINFLSSHNSPLFIVNYPHIYYLSNKHENPNVNNNFDSTDPMNIFFSIIDVFYSAIQKIEGGEKVKIAVGETGWPSAGDEEIASVRHAKKYVWDLSKHVLSKNGTTLRPGGQIETYVYAMFNEDMREGLWKNFGMFRTDLKPVYDFPPLN